MATLRNIQFTKLIKTGGSLREFNFRKNQGKDSPMFIVDVAEQKDERQYLFFRQEEKRWVLEKRNLIAWIEDALPEIEKAIEVYA